VGQYPPGRSPGEKAGYATDKYDGVFPAVALRKGDEADHAEPMTNSRSVTDPTGLTASREAQSKEPFDERISTLIAFSAQRETRSQPAR
jgi:hypothetical protein